MNLPKQQQYHDRTEYNEDRAVTAEGRIEFSTKKRQRTVRKENKANAKKQPWKKAMNIVAAVMIEWKVTSEQIDHNHVN